MFSKKTSLFKHIALVHEEKKSYHCKICGISLKSGLDKHISIIHERGKTYICEICNGEYLSEQSLHQHIAIVHEQKKPYVCDLCGVGTVYKSTERFTTLVQVVDPGSVSHKTNVQRPSYYARL